MGLSVVVDRDAHGKGDPEGPHHPHRMNGKSTRYPFGLPVLRPSQGAAFVRDFTLGRRLVVAGAGHSGASLRHFLPGARDVADRF
jgi:hypothetical protein